MKKGKYYNVCPYVLHFGWWSWYDDQFCHLFAWQWKLGEGKDSLWEQIYRKQFRTKIRSDGDDDLVVGRRPIIIVGQLFEGLGDGSTGTKQKIIRRTNYVKGNILGFKRLLDINHIFFWQNLLSLWIFMVGVSNNLRIFICVCILVWICIWVQIYIFLKNPPLQSCVWCFCCCLFDLLLLFGV